MERTSILSSTFVFLIYFLGSGFAQEPAAGGETSIDPELEKLLQLDIEELLVSVASKRDEKIGKAPGIVTVITADDIRRYGANNLNDLLARLPNTFSFGSFVFWDNITSIRAQTTNHFDNHVLILLNNRPMRESQSGGINTSIYQNFPLETIKRIEVIRGPGSVLYGSNGFPGVINIVTWDADDLMARDNSVTAGYGSYKTFQISGLVKATHGDFSVMGSGKYMNTDGWDFNFRNTFGTPRTFEHDRENYGGFAQAKYKRLTFTGFSGGDKTILPQELNGILGMGPFRTRRHFFDAQYDQPLGENWDASLNVTYNGFFLKLGAFSPPEAPRPLIGTVNMNDLLIEPSIKGSMLDGKLNILMGYTFQRLRGTITELGPGFDVTFVNDWHNEYLQVDYSPWDFLKIIAGVQFNKVTGVPLNISPRGGAIVNFSPEVGIKLLYGEAFRAAYALEKASLGPLVIGNPTLQSEQIATFDAQLFYTSKKFKASLTYYFSKQTQTITEVFTPPVLFPIFIPPQINYINSGVINYEGIEFETQWQISPGWSFMGSMSYQENHDDTGLYDVGLIPNFMAKAGISYVSPEGISVGLFNSYYSDSAKLQGTLPLNPPAEGHNWMTFKGSVPLKALTDRSDIPNMIFSIYGENLLVEDVYFPELF